MEIHIQESSMKLSNQKPKITKIPYHDNNDNTQETHTIFKRFQKPLVDKCQNP